MAEKITFKRIAILFSGFVFVLYGGLILSLLYFFDKDVFFKAAFSERAAYSILLSLSVATVVTVISLLIAIPAAYALSRYNFQGRSIIDTILELPMVVSPAALGAMLLIFFNNPLGGFIQENFAQFVFTVYGIILAQFVTTLGVCIRLVKAAMDEIPQRYEDVARCLGVPPFKTFLKVTLPLSKNGIIAASILTWAKAVGEFGATFTVAGSMAMNTETLPVAIYMRLSTADIEGTVALIIILLILGLSTLYIVRILTNKRVISD
ncbi:MAG: ABC transporter permease [Deferribacterales bacterium]|jgi:molybdate transport system permease protein|uniref:ABC transporter permease n=1 Tax=Deferrivibrio essentukiensis TaxID=2880922 RepID=UPI0019A988B7|nr:ABC transporter permease [Deferrivibrio essentukiensis]MBC7197298.1 ABC transporter permease [Deferribacterales bacterium]MCB4204774.1 ABC transporter permease [Deferrivibrio essentukiensis]